MLPLAGYLRNIYPSLGLINKIIKIKRHKMLTNVDRKAKNSTDQKQKVKVIQKYIFDRSYSIFRKRHVSKLFRYSRTFFKNRNDSKLVKKSHSTYSLMLFNKKWVLMFLLI